MWTPPWVASTAPIPSGFTTLDLCHDHGTSYAHLGLVLCEHGSNSFRLHASPLRLRHQACSPRLKRTSASICTSSAPFPTDAAPRNTPPPAPGSQPTTEAHLNLRLSKRSTVPHRVSAFDHGTDTSQPSAEAPHLQPVVSAGAASSATAPTAALASRPSAKSPASASFSISSCARTTVGI